MAKAISDMALRGAPLIGCAAAYGYALALHRSPLRTGRKELEKRLAHTCLVLKKSRPTAVALSWAVDRLNNAATKFLNSCGQGATIDPASFMRLRKLIDNEARRIFAEDARSNDAMAGIGAKLLKKKSVIMTHCNAGALATAGIGTALGVIYRAHRLGRIKHAYACETRPYMQGSRLTMWELMQAKIPCTLITDSMAAHIIKTCHVDAVIVGADRIASNGDTANKIGTYGLAVIARHHRIPFYVAAPVPTIDASLETGEEIPIEERDPLEVCRFRGTQVSPHGARARHPAFDVTPGNLITAIITEKGIARPVNKRNVLRLLV